MSRVNELPRILVCGSRNLANPYLEDKEEYNKQYYFISSKLDKICLDRNWITEKDEYGNYLLLFRLINGGAYGADLAADTYAVVNGLPIDVFKADWETYGKAAGPIRNKQMLEEGKPDLVVAFYYDLNNKSKGTSHMVSIAKKAGVEVLEYGYLNE